MSNVQTTANTNTALDGGGYNTYLNKEFVDRKLLEVARTRFVHAQFGQPRSIPRNHGKRVEFRRWDLFSADAAKSPLTEGVTPSGQSLSQTRVEAEVSQYGAYVEVSDLLDRTATENVIADSADLLGEQLGTVVEWVARDEMNSGNLVQYARTSDVTPTSRLAVTTACKLTVNEIRRAVRTLKKNKARMFVTSPDGAVRKPHFICICSPEATYDLQSDALWQDVSKYSNAEQIYSGEIGRLFGVVFVESTEAKVFQPSVTNAVSAATSSSATFVLANDPTAAEAAYLSTGGNKLYIDGTEVTLASSDSYTAATKTVKLSASATLAKDAKVYSQDAGACDSTSKVCCDVHSTLVFGADAYGVVDIGGEGGIELIIKDHGSAGAADPLNQRATVGAKVGGFAAKVLNQLWIVRIEHAVSA
ncbi:MAG: N4-gp56 family major capsid protein [Eubacteriales bacterium]|nr:N4-gp56 family major capsid protein [Eubacteriales bacterium]